MALYKTLLFLVMHCTVYELTDAPQCPVFMAALAKAQLALPIATLLQCSCQNRVPYFNISYLKLHFTTY